MKRRTQRRFGVELEVVGVTHREAQEALTSDGIPCMVEDYNHSTRDYWKVVMDASVEGSPEEPEALAKHAAKPRRPCAYEAGNVPRRRECNCDSCRNYSGRTRLQSAEVVSPPTRDLLMVRNACRALTNAGAGTNRSCGVHVHVEAEHGGKVGDLRMLQRIHQIYACSEAAIDSFMPPSRRGTSNSYCKTVTSPSLATHMQLATNIEDVTYGERQSKLNLNAFRKYGTVEFRHHSGTLNPRKLTYWIQVCEAMVFLAAGKASVPTKALNLSEFFGLLSIPTRQGAISALTTPEPYVKQGAARLAWLNAARLAKLGAPPALIAEDCLRRGVDRRTTGAVVAHFTRLVRDTRTPLAPVMDFYFKRAAGFAANTETRY